MTLNFGFINAPPRRRSRRLLTSTATPRGDRHKDCGHDSSHHQQCSGKCVANYGLLITVDDENHLCLQFSPDCNLREVHPNSYAPADMENVHKLGGGGSGVAVFAGHHAQLGDVVMKHGGDKDLTELFSLETVAQELQERSADHPDAAKHIQQRIPAFRMIYISPHHLGENRLAMWRRLREINRTNRSGILLPVSEQDSNNSHHSHDDNTNHSPTSFHSLEGSYNQYTMIDEEDEIDEDDDNEEHMAMESFRMLKNCSILDRANTKDHVKTKLPPGMDISKSETISGHRDIAIVAAPLQRRCKVKLQNDTLMFVVPDGHFETEGDDPKHTSRIRIRGDGYQELRGVYEDLLGLMKSHRWKFTLGQKRIGGDDAMTGNEWLYSNRLRGPVLDNLVSQNIKLVRDLVRLTKLNEQDPVVLERIREEAKRIEQFKGTVEASKLSTLADNFVGGAIRKNFQSETGRIPVLLKLGRHFREHTEQQGPKSLLPQPVKKGNPGGESMRSNLILTPEEEVPAYHLGMITQPGALVGSTFERAPLEPTVLDTMDSQYWKSLLSTAVQSPHESTMVWKRLWTCGLADAGLHNLFCSDSRIWLFDLGEPQLTSVPGFLTKFLFSFFHTLGMEEPAEENGTWVRRFEFNRRNQKLRLTYETSRLLTQAYSAFSVAMDRIVGDLFNNDDDVRWLLLQYVTLQLISDASFCLQKWTIKGGGRSRGTNHQECLEKWLWRALWDIYVACDINSLKSMQQLKVRLPEADSHNRVSQSLRDRQMALIKELSLEAWVEDPHALHRAATGFQSWPFVNAK